MPAAAARWRSGRVAAWQCILVVRVLSRIGPSVRCPMARCMARLTAGGSVIRTTFGAFVADSQDAVAVPSTEVGDVGAGGLEDQRAEHRDEGEVAGV